MPSPCPPRRRRALRQPRVGGCGDGAAVVGRPVLQPRRSEGAPPPPTAGGASSWCRGGQRRRVPVRGRDWHLALVSAVIVLVGRERAGSVPPRAGVSRTRPCDLANLDWRACPAGGACREEHAASYADHRRPSAQPLGRRCRAACVPASLGPAAAAPASRRSRHLVSLDADADPPPTAEPPRRARRAAATRRRRTGASAVVDAPYAGPCAPAVVDFGLQPTTRRPRRKPDSKSRTRKSPRHRAPTSTSSPAGPRIPD